MNSRDIYENIKYLSLFNEIDERIENVVIDTRKVKIHDCYVGIKGENFDGNLFVKEALEKGASLAIVERFDASLETIKYLQENGKSVMVVENTIRALGNLARFKRSQFTSPVIAVTGSAGKTSTKDMIYSVLKQKYNAQKTIGNQNNHLGLPLTVLSLKPDADMLVLEMGMNHLKEISYLTSIARPNVAIITNVGTAHIGNLKSRENILKAKLEILEGLAPGGKVIINKDNDLLAKWYEENNGNYDIITIGIESDCDYKATNVISLDNGSKFTCNGYEYFVPTPGDAFVYNALVAIAVGYLFNIDDKNISLGIKDFKLSTNRMHIIKKDGICLIDDSYNANFDSMKYAINYLSTLRGRNIAVLGSMKELGDYSLKLHEDIGKIAGLEDIDILVTVGEEAKYINKGFEMYSKALQVHFEAIDDAIKYVKGIIGAGDNILVKASNSMNFKKIVEGLQT